MEDAKSNLLIEVSGTVTLTFVITHEMLSDLKFEFLDVMSLAATVIFPLLLLYLLSSSYAFEMSITVP